ncbi:hypothetical protein K227x_40170 [Rubripirellula lacrimiformis]|uniref:Uncharacterized protein n=1 Tax=Rubripirellula lacrimiformis TaxID=1930273 RepID=A0A517NEQ6_9BACT|nr:hypothetical protein K227x_40170 [Rubripirellula lacrimiformis]
MEVEGRESNHEVEMAIGALIRGAAVREFSDQIGRCSEPLCYGAG